MALGVPMILTRITDRRIYDVAVRCWRIMHAVLDTMTRCPIIGQRPAMSVRLAAVRTADVNDAVSTAIVNVNGDHHRMRCCVGNGHLSVLSIRGQPISGPTRVSSLAGLWGRMFAG